MKIEVLRFSSQSDSTIGLVFIDDEFQCYSIEDEHRDEKVMHETRIPEGTYPVVLRTEGGFHQRYLKKYGEDFHKGMLHITDVPNFQWILIHTGNTDDHTSGCLLLGNTANNNRHEAGFIGKSGDAYRDFYPKVLKALQAGEPVHITYKTIG